MTNGRHFGLDFQYGLFDIPDDLTMGGNDNDALSGDSDLEAELAAITGGGGKKKLKTKSRTPAQMPLGDLDAMVAESLKDVDTDVDSDDENDPNLLSELGELTGDSFVPEAPEPTEEVFVPTSSTVNIQEIIKQRIEMYTIAEKNAKDAGESGKARRFARGLKTLKDLQKSASAGKTIPMEDIPPEVSIKPLKSSAEEPETSPATPSRAAPAPPVSPPASAPAPPVNTTNKSAMDALNERKNEYKTAALAAKKNGDTATALKLVRIIKQFDVVIKAVEDGQEVDLNEMPPHPWELVSVFFLVPLVDLQGN